MHRRSGRTLRDLVEASSQRGVRVVVARERREQIDRIELDLLAAKTTVAAARAGIRWH